MNYNELERKVESHLYGDLEKEFETVRSSQSGRTELVEAFGDLVSGIEFKHTSFIDNLRSSGLITLREYSSIVHNYADVAQLIMDCIDWFIEGHQTFEEYCEEVRGDLAQIEKMRIPRLLKKLKDVADSRGRDYCKLLEGFLEVLEGE